MTAAIVLAMVFASLMTLLSPSAAWAADIAGMSVFLDSACVDERAAAANAIRRDADISIHADGGPASRRGFHVNYSAPPLNDAQKDPSLQLATVMSDSMVATGMQSSSDIGSDRLYGLADLAGPNLVEYPAVLVEIGLMRNVDDAAQMEMADGRQRYADAITQGIVSYLKQKASAA